MLACEHACVRTCPCVHAYVCTHMCMHMHARMHACVHAYMCMRRTVPAYTAAPPQRSPLLLMPEDSLGLQVASSLHCCCILLCCSSPSHLLTVRLLGLNNAHNKLFVPLRGLPGPFPFMLTKVINFASFAGPLYFSYIMCSLEPGCGAWHSPVLLRRRVIISAVHQTSDATDGQICRNLSEGGVAQPVDRQTAVKCTHAFTNNLRKGK
jgi:hypothetical protein